MESRCWHKSPFGLKFRAITPCAILLRMNDNDTPDWIDNLKARGLGGPLHIALDVLEPLGPLGAQLMWLTQPVLGLVVNTKTVNEIAEALETPDGIENLRRRLEE